MKRKASSEVTRKLFKKEHYVKPPFTERVIGLASDVWKDVEDLHLSIPVRKWSAKQKEGFIKVMNGLVCVTDKDDVGGHGDLYGIIARANAYLLEGNDDEMLQWLSSADTPIHANVGNVGNREIKRKLFKKEHYVKPPFTERVIGLASDVWKDVEDLHLSIPVRKWSAKQKEGFIKVMNGLVCVTDKDDVGGHGDLYSIIARANEYLLEGNDDEMLQWLSSADTPIHANVGNC